MIHHLAAIGNEVDYWTDEPMSYAMEPVLKQPPTLKSFVFHDGKDTLANSPRLFHPLDVRKIVDQHNTLYGGGIENYVVKKPYDLIFATVQTGIEMGIWLKDLLGIPLVVQILDVPWWRLTQYGPSEIYKQSLVPLPLLSEQLFQDYRTEWGWWLSQIPKIDLITTILEEAKKHIVQFSGCPPEKIAVCAHGSVDADTFDFYLKKHESLERKNRVLVVERIDFHKGVDQSVWVCRLIQEMMGPDSPEFIFASRGNTEWYEKLVMDSAKLYLKNYRFVGWVDNPTKIRLIRESKVMLVNEWPNGFGSCTIGEAVYSGTQMIGWDTPSKKEVHPGGGFTRVPLGEYHAMAEAAVEHLRNFKETLPEEREWVKKYRSNLSHAQSIDAILRTVVKKKG